MSYDRYKNLFENASLKTGVPLKLLHSVAKQESNFNPNATSSAGAYGLMQLMPATAKELGFDINDPEQNVMAGATYLKQMHDNYGGDWGKAVLAYNQGPGNVNRNHIGPAGEDYVRKVANNLGVNMDTNMAWAQKNNLFKDKKQNSDLQTQQDIQTAGAKAAFAGSGKDASQPSQPTQEQPKHKSLVSQVLFPLLGLLAGTAGGPAGMAFGLMSGLAGSKVSDQQDINNANAEKNMELLNDFRDSEIAKNQAEADAKNQQTLQDNQTSTMLLPKLMEMIGGSVTGNGGIQGPNAGSNVGFDIPQATVTNDISGVKVGKKTVR